MSIGTTSPAHTLDINGGVRSTNFTTTIPRYVSKNYKS